MTVNLLKVFSCAFLSLVIPVTSAMETNPLRDFSKLRLEPASSSSNAEDYTSSTSTTSRSSSVRSSPSYGGGYGEFKPSYNDNQMDSYSEVEPGNNNELYDSNPMMPSMPPSRPLVQNDGDESSSSGSNYFSSPQNNPGSNMDKPGGGGQNPEDLFFVPQPPSQSFLAEVEYDSGVSSSAVPEKGMGGLFDDEDDSEGNPEGEGEGAGSDNPDEYYGHQGGSQYGHENPGQENPGQENPGQENPGQENSEDGRRGYGGPGSGGGSDGGRYSSFGGSSDYGDY